MILNLKNLSWQNAAVFVAIVSLTIYAAFKPSLQSVIGVAITSLLGLIAQSPVAPADQVVTRSTLADHRARMRSLHAAQPNREDKTS